MSGSSHGNATSTTQPWKPQQPYLKDIFSQANSLQQTPFQYYGGNTLAGFTPEQQQAQQAVSQRASAGSDLTRTAQAQTLATARGDYVNPQSNPYINNYIQRGLEQTLPAWDSSANQAGRFGGSSWALGRGRQIADTTSGIMGGAYNAERGYQNQAVAAAPGMAAQDYADMAKLAAVGEEKQAMNQSNINEDIKRYNFGQMEPWQRLGMFDQLIEGNYGGTVAGGSAGGK